MKAIIFDYNRTLFNPEKNALFPGAVAILKTLKPKFKLALVAKGDRSRRKEIEKLGLPEYFSAIMISEEKGIKDFMSCMEQLKIWPKETYVIGDRALKEILFGKALGCTTIWFRNGKYSEELPRDITGMPAYTITSLKEILKIIK